MKAILIRHGKTKGNAEQRYIGTTDECLTNEGIEEIKKISYPRADIVITSPMVRCIQTAEIIYGKYDDIFVGLRECNFGTFENKNFMELKDDVFYQKWLESGGKLPFPMGENKDDFSKRCLESFKDAVNKYKSSETVAFVVHGGTIMSIAQYYIGGEFYDYHLKNGEYMIISL